MLAQIAITFYFKPSFPFVFYLSLNLFLAFCVVPPPSLSCLFFSVVVAVCYFKLFFINFYFILDYSKESDTTEWLSTQLIYNVVLLSGLQKSDSVQFSSVQSLSRVRLFATPWIAARQASLSITNSRSSLRLTTIESVMPSHPLSSPPTPAPNHIHIFILFLILFPFTFLQNIEQSSLCNTVNPCWLSILNIVCLCGC